MNIFQHHPAGAAQRRTAPAFSQSHLPWLGSISMSFRHSDDDTETHAAEEQRRRRARLSGLVDQCVSVIDQPSYVHWRVIGWSAKPFCRDLVLLRRVEIGAWSDVWRPVEEIVLKWEGCNASH